MQIIDQYKKEIHDLKLLKQEEYNAKLKVLSELNEFKQQMVDNETLHQNQIDDLEHDLMEEQKQNEILKKEKDDIIVQFNQLQLTNNNNVESIQSITNESKQRENELLKQMKQQLDIFVKKYEKLKKEKEDLHLQLLNNNNNSMTEPLSQIRKMSFKSSSDDKEKRENINQQLFNQLTRMSKEQEVINGDRIIATYCANNSQISKNLKDHIEDLGGADILKMIGFRGTVFELTRINKVEEKTSEELYQRIEEGLKKGERFTLQTLKKLNEKLHFFNDN